MIRSLATSVAASLLVISSVSAQQETQGTPTATSSDISAQVNMLVAAITAAVGDRAATASVADLEGIIAFTISQGDYSSEVIDAALAQMEATATGNLLQAIKNVRKALAANGTGTGATLPGGGIAGGGGGNAGGGISAPGVGSGGGGGTVDYAT